MKIINKQKKIFTLLVLSAFLYLLFLYFTYKGYIEKDKNESLQIIHLLEISNDKCKFIDSIYDQYKERKKLDLFYNMLLEYSEKHSDYFWFHCEKLNNKIPEKIMEKIPVKEKL